MSIQNEIPISEMTEPQLLIFEADLKTDRLSTESALSAVSTDIKALLSAKGKQPTQELLQEKDDLQDDLRKIQIDAGEIKIRRQQIHLKKQEDHLAKEEQKKALQQADQADRRHQDLVTQITCAVLSNPTINKSQETNNLLTYSANLAQKISSLKAPSQS